LEEVLRLLGEPAAISERHEGDESVTTYEFPRGQNRILIAEFVNGALVRSRTETRGQLALGAVNLETGKATHESRDRNIVTNGAAGKLGQ